MTRTHHHLYPNHDHHITNSSSIHQRHQPTHLFIWIHVTIHGATQHNHCGGLHTYRRRRLKQIHHPDNGHRDAGGRQRRLHFVCPDGRLQQVTYQRARRREHVLLCVCVSSRHFVLCITLEPTERARNAEQQLFIHPHPLSTLRACFCVCAVVLMFF